MNRRLDNLLVKNHPTLFADRYGDMRNTAMCWGFECGDGWYKLLKKACDEIEPILAAYRAKDPKGWGYGYYRATQVKEKFGTLRFYLSGAPKEIYKFIKGAEEESAKTCETCGKPGKLRGKGWLYTACEKHAKGGPSIS